MGSRTRAPATRDRIVDTALRLSSEKGTSAVSMRELSDAAGVTVLGDADALAVGGALAEDWRSRWQAVLAGADDLEPEADVVAAADVIATFLWGLFVEYLNHHDPTVAGRIEAFAGLVAPALRGSGSRGDTS